MTEIPSLPIAPDAAAEPEAQGTSAGATESPAPGAAEPDVVAAGSAPAAVVAPSSAPAAGAADVTQQLRQMFPALFSGPAKPVKLRIQVDIQARAPGVFSKQALSAFFRRLTGSTSYLIAVSKATQRFDLDGQPAGELSAEHRQAALDELARRRANQRARQDLEDQQRRNRAGLWRDFQTTTLTRANFCVLKGVAPEALDELLALARAEAEELARQSRERVVPRADARPNQRPDRRPGSTPHRHADAGAPRGPEGRRRGPGGRPPRPGPAR